MRKEALEFLDRWLGPHIAAVSAYVEPDRDRFGQLAESCSADAAKDGLQRGELDEAAGGDLAGFLYSAVLGAYKEEMARVRKKD